MVKGLPSRWHSIIMRKGIDNSTEYTTYPVNEPVHAQSRQCKDGSVITWDPGWISYTMHAAGVVD